MPAFIVAVVFVAVVVVEDEGRSRVTRERRWVVGCGGRGGRVEEVEEELVRRNVPPLGCTLLIVPKSQSSNTFNPLRKDS